MPGGRGQQRRRRLHAPARWPPRLPSGPAGQAAQDRAAQPPVEAPQPLTTIVQEVVEEEEQRGPLDAPMQVCSHKQTSNKARKECKGCIFHVTEMSCQRSASYAHACCVCERQGGAPLSHCKLRALKTSGRSPPE